MSFYFYLDTRARPSLNDILRRIPIDNVSAMTPQEDFSPDAPLTTALTFYQPGQSVRGVRLNPVANGYEICLNAFTPLSDGKLCAALVQAAASAAQCPVRPEDSTGLLSATEVAAFCNEEWLQSRRSEADAALAVCTQTDGSPQDVTISGYRRDFTVSGEIALSLQREGLRREEVVERFLSEARDLQEIDQIEDIFAANVLTISPKETPTDTDRTPADYFVLPPATRTLSQPVDYVLLSVESDRGRIYRRLPFALFKAHAQARSYRRFGANIFDIPPLPVDEYLELYGQAEPM